MDAKPASRRPATRKRRDARLDAAIQAHRSGDVAAARALLTEVLETTPRNAKALQLLGVSYLQQGESARGLPCFERSLAAAPKDKETRIALGCALMLLQRPAEAQVCFETVLASDPGNVSALNNLGLALKSLQRHDDALECFAAALRFEPDHAEAGYNLANTLAALGKFAEALAQFERTLAAHPRHCGAHVNRGGMLMTLGRAQEAIASFEAALAIEPGNPIALASLGGALAALNRHAAALTFLAKAAALKPDDAEMRVALGNALQKLDRYEEAAAEYREALALRPDYAEAHNNLGSVLGALLRGDAALAHFDHALSLRPGLAEAASNKSLALLRRGDYAAGWPLYESRWRRSDVRRPAPCACPVWLGAEDLAGKTLLIQHEQGLGDAIQMLRFVPWLEALGARCLIQSKPVLADLLRRSFPLAIITGPDHCPPQADFRIPLMSLPLALGIRSEERIPVQVPYLSADAAKVQRWAARLAAHAKPAVGLAWRGNPTYAEDRNRSLRLALLQPLLEQRDFHFFALQKDLAPAESALLARHPNVTRLQAGEDSLDDVAALVSALQCVVSVDTVHAHLAGALARRTWVLLASYPTWVWQLGREDCAWYPTARLFRQKTAGDWRGVILAVGANLRALREAAQ